MIQKENQKLYNTDLFHGNNCKRILFFVIFISFTSFFLFSENQASRDKIYTEALTWLGTPYVWGAASKKGTDCSGFTSGVFKKAINIELPRSVKELYKLGIQVETKNANVGDLIIFDTVGGPSHVGIYIGEEKVIHAASAGSKTGVIISSLTETYYKTRILSIRAILENMKTETESSMVSESLDKNPEAILSCTITERPNIVRSNLPCLVNTRVIFSVLNKRKDVSSLTYKIFYFENSGELEKILASKSIVFKYNEYSKTEALLLTKLGYYKLDLLDSQNVSYASYILKVIEE